jgi:hypothetical protein
VLPPGVLLVSLLGLVEEIIPQDGMIGHLDKHHKLLPSPLSPPFRTATFPGITPKEWEHIFLSHDYLIRFRHQTSSLGESDIYLYGSSGSLEHEIAVSPTDAVRFFLASVDVGANKQLVFSGKMTGPGGNQSAFIAISDLDGKRQRYFSTYDYFATQISVAPDGSIWTIGAERPRSSNQLDSWKNYDVLRHYDSNGILLEHFMPRWGNTVDFVTRVEDGEGQWDLAAYDSKGNRIDTYTAPSWGPTMGYTMTNISEGQTYLRATATGVVLFDGLNRRILRYITGQGLSTWSIKIPMQTQQTVTGFGVLSNSAIYGSLIESETYSNQIGASFEGKTFGLFQMSFQEGDPTTAVWVRVPNASVAGHLEIGSVSRLLGCDQSELVYIVAQPRGVLPIVATSRQ